MTNKKMNAASTSKPSYIVEVGEASTSDPGCVGEVYRYPYPSHVSVRDFVTVKLSGINKYNMWKTQIVCLLKGHEMYGFVNGQFPCPGQGSGKGKVGDMEAWVASDSLVKGWILGSLSEETAKKAVNHLRRMQKNPDFTAKDLWDGLERIYGPLAAPMTKEEQIDEIWTEEDCRIKVYRSALKGQTNFVIAQLEVFDLKPYDKLMSNGYTALHVAVDSSTKNHELLKTLLERINPKEYKLLDLIDPKGSTLLHVAAIGGNIKAVNMLVERNPELLLAKDMEGHIPLALSVSNMHTKISHCLFEHMKVYRYLLEEKEKEYDALLRGEVIMTCKTFEQEEKKYGDLNTGKSGEDIKTSKCLIEQQKKEFDALFTGKSGEELVVLAISYQDFCLARQIILLYPNVILSDSDAVLTVLAQNFPRELNSWERRGFGELKIILDTYFDRVDDIYMEFYNSRYWQGLLCAFRLHFIGLCVLQVVFYQFLKVLVRPFVEDTFQVHEDATSLLSDVCLLLKHNSGTYHKYYTNSIFEATRQNASTFIRTIMRWFPDAIWSTNEDGHNFIQYSVINRSEKIYNLLYEMSVHKNIYKTIRDSLENNLLHLAARLAPASKLNLISGAALQIQRELQWFTEVERFVCRLNGIQKNSDKDTPKMVFTKQHERLLIQGEDWTKKTAESYTITAALIITIVFTAAITVPGGNNQESGIPIFADNIAFTLFAISDAISLFTAVTSLLVFLSILTSRFAEQDFLLKLPTKLIIGLTMLFLSTTAMIIAFGATLFLMFGQGNSSMLIPIGALTCLPITSFVTLQFPLIWELIRATYCGGFFVRERYDYFY